MAEKIDWCKYFGDIEKDHSAITPRITIRQLYEAREHVRGCDACNVRVNKVLAQAPKERFPERGEN